MLRVKARGKRLLMITASLDSFGQVLAIWSFSIFKIGYTENPLLSVNDNTIAGWWDFARGTVGIVFM